MLGINFSSYIDCEISSQRASDSKDFLIGKFLVVQGCVLQVVLP